MKKVWVLFGLVAGSAWGQITWTKAWTGPASGASGTFFNGYLDIHYDPFTNRTWVFSTDTNSGPDAIYSSRLHYFDSTAATDTLVGTSNQPASGGCLSSSASWPYTHHPVGQIWIDSIRHRLWMMEGAGCAFIYPEQWYYQLDSPISGHTNWVQVHPPHLPTRLYSAGPNGVATPTVGGLFNNASVLHDTDHDAFLLFGYDGGSNSHAMQVYCDTSQNPSPGTLTAAQQSVGCTNADDWTDITPQTKCAAGSKCITAGGVGWTPPGYYYPNLEYDSVHHQVIQFAGLYGAYTVENQTWVYNMLTKTWTNMNPANPPANSSANNENGRVGHAFNSNDGKYYYHLTSHAPASGQPPARPPEDWVYDPGANTWTQLSIGQGPQLLDSITYDSKANALIAWALQVESNGIYVAQGIAEMWVGKLTVPPPTVSLSAPANGASVTRMITVAARATATAGISGVQFEVDGAALSSAVTGAGPLYILSWDTTTTTDGSHTLSAIATDTAGQTATSTISITVVNQLAVSQRVQTTTNLSVYDTPSSSGTVLGSQPAGALGTILSGPSSDGQNLWWQINFDNSPSGWTMDTLLAPLPSLSIPANSWVVTQPTFIGTPNGGQLYPQSWGNKGTYDPVTHRVIVSDRWADLVRGYISIFANGIHAFDPVLNVWTVLKLNNWYAQTNPDGSYTTLPLPANTTDPTPADHYPLTSLEAVPQLNSVYVVNGINNISLPDPSILNTTWQFNLGTLSWASVSAATTDPNYPPNITDSPSGLIYDPIGQQLAYLVPSAGGCSGTATYVFNLTANTWSIPAQDPSSLGVYVAGAGVTYDSKRNLLMAYGGGPHVSSINNTGTAHLWAYSIGQNKWTQLADAPVPAMAPAFAYDSTHDIFLALVGNNTYTYNPNTNTWTQFPATLNRPIAVQTWQGITYNPAYDLFIFEGGNQLGPLIALFRYDPNSLPQITLDTVPPTASITSPSNGAVVSGTVTISATASEVIPPNTNNTVGVIGLQFQLDGANMAGVTAGPGPYSIPWNTTQVSNGTHTLSVIAYDEVENTGTASISVAVNNPLAGPVITGVAASAITASGATINWTTDTASDSQVGYGLTAAYGSISPLGTNLVKSHSVILSGLAGSTTYHYQVQSRANGILSSSLDFTFTTGAAASTLLLQLHLDATEVSGTSNGSTVAPSTAPAGFSGTVVVNGAGSVNFTPAQVGNGVYFMNCCSSTNDGYYKFTGAAIGNIFNVSQGEVSFYLVSRRSFAQRQASASSPRYAFDVRDASNHLFYFLTEVNSGNLIFAYSAGAGAQYYYVPKGTEDTLFGNAVSLNVAIQWNGSTSSLYLNGTVVQSSSYTQPTPNWTAGSNFDIGAYEYLTYGGYNVSDDIIDEFTVSGPPIVIDTTPPTVSMTAPANGATVSGPVIVSANATDNVAVASVQFQLDGVNLGGPQTGAGPSYSVSWATTTAVNGSHTLSAIASDAAGNMATSSVSVTVSNAVVPPVISGVSAGSITSSGATIGWTTSTPSSSQVTYGLDNSYGSLTALSSTLVILHSVNLSGLAASTTYHYQVMSQDSQGNLVTSADLTFITSGGPLLQLHLDATEVSGTSNGSTVAPSTAPAGFSGTVVVNGAGSVNFTPAQVGNGVYFLNCCSSTNDGYYKFTGAAIGNIFNVSQGEVSFYLVSRRSFAQRQASASSPRYAFDVRDASNHLFYFLTDTTSGRLVFSYTVSGIGQFYYVPAGTEDTLFGNGVSLNVMIQWNGSTSSLYLNGTVVQSSSYTQPTPNWTAGSKFDIGAYEYLTYGGYNVSDDIIDEFTVGPLQ